MIDKSNTSPDETLRRDEALLIDVLLGQADEAGRNQLARKLAEDPEFRRRHESASHALSALRLLPVPEPPSDLTARTMGRIRSARRTEQLIDQQEIRRRRILPLARLKEFAAVAIVLILVGAVFIPSLRSLSQDAQARTCAANLGETVYPGLKHWADGHNGQLPGRASRVLRWWPSANQAAVSNSSALFDLVRDHYTPSLAFACPAQSGSSDSFDVQAGMVDFPAPKFVSYSYQYSIGQAPNLQSPQLGPVLDNLAVMADSNPVFSGGRIRPERAGTCSDNHGGGGQNVLYATGDVRWCGTSAAGVDGDDIYLAGSLRRYNGDEAPIGPTDSFLLPAWSGAPDRR